MMTYQILDGMQFSIDVHVPLRVSCNPSGDFSSGAIIR